MADITTTYLGLELPGPVIVGSSPFTADADKIASLAQHGAGAVVLKSIFEEQIAGEAASLERYSDYPEAADYLHRYIGENNLERHLELIAAAKSRVEIPVIASINCYSDGDWIEYARRMVDAGADALELNIYLLPTDMNLSSDAIESGYLDTVSRVTAAVSVPVSVKLGMRFTNIGRIAMEAYYRKARGVVMYNRFFEPDIDVDSMRLVSTGSALSHPSELRNALRTVAMCSSQLPALDIAVSTGVHSGEDAVKALLAGASAVQVCSTLFLHGLDVIGEINSYLARWMRTHTFPTVGSFRGALSFREYFDKNAYLRVQYMKTFM